MAEGLSGGCLALFDAVRQWASEGEPRVYLVGGPVRDALLDAPLLDLDFAVEGDAVATARLLAKRLGGRLTVHSRFGTATIVSGGDRIDLVTARQEVYPEPGQLPQVSPGSIFDDLARRDFSINAMALSLSPAAGGLIDPLGGLDDLEAGVIRALHPGSFVDDPTRILRAVRYEQRFGFRIDGATLAYMAEAVSGGYMDAVSGDRWRHELERILEEANPGPPLLRAAELGLLAGLHPALAASEGLRRLVARINESEQPAGPDDWLASLFCPLSAVETDGLIRRLRLTGRRAALARDTIELKESEPQVRATAGRALGTGPDAVGPGADGGLGLGQAHRRSSRGRCPAPVCWRAAVREAQPVRRGAAGHGCAGGAGGRRNTGPAARRTAGRLGERRGRRTIPGAGAAVRWPGGLCEVESFDKLRMNDGRTTY